MHLQGRHIFRELILDAHPHIQSIACVLSPTRFWPSASAPMSLASGGEPQSFDAIIELLTLPERLEMRQAFLMTPSGKIQKVIPRQEIAKLTEQETTATSA